MIESIMSLKISGRCFTPAAKLKCFTQDKSRISIIYGKNGSGKSTISKALCKVEPDLRSELLDKNNNKVSVRQDNIFIFNEDYIKNNVEVQDDGLSAVILLGEQVDIDKQITEANFQLEKIKSELETERTTKTILEDVKNSDSYKYKIDKLKDKLKASDNWTGREFSISGKRPNITVTTLQKIFNHVPDSKNKEEAIARFKESMSIIGTAHRGKITGVMKPVLFENTFFQNISELLAEKIEQPILNDRDKLIIEIYKQKGSQFIAEVKDIFNNETQNICPYCFRAITNEEKNSILLGVEKVLSEIAKKHQLKLQQYKKQISQAIDALDKNIMIADNLKNIYTDEYDAFEVQYKIINSLLVEYMQWIEDKINSIYNPILLVDNNIVQELHKLNLVIECLEKKRSDYNNQIDKINESKQKASVWNTEIAYWEFYAEYTEYQKAWYNYQKCCEKFNKCEVDFSVQEAKIEELLNQKKNVAIAKDNINKALSYIFFSTNRLQLDVDAENGKYYLISNGIKVTPNKVSTGERNIVALCYFFTQILNNHESTDNYKRMYLEAKDARAICVEILKEKHLSFVEQYQKLFFESIGTEENPIIVRIFLASSRNFKHDRILAFKEEDICKKIYSATPFPQFVWVCELYDLKYYKDQKPLGEIVLDATSTANTKPFDSVIMINYPGKYLTRHYNGSSNKIIEDIICELDCLSNLETVGKYKLLKFETKLDCFKMYKSNLHKVSNL